ncbi:MAG: hypothetical protein KAT70_09030, partial [Thermoplasmata archaeon]|nr:hypothetical protein [Thermoplasmata archaeon]
NAAMEQTTNEMCAINGYDPMQSAVVYETTGDSDDWIYGYSWYTLGRLVSAHTIEVGDSSFHPPATEIEGLCAENLPVNIHASYVAKNPYRSAPVITHTPHPDTTDTTGPWTMTADINFPGEPVGAFVDLYWDSGSGWTGPVAMTGPVGNTWSGNIPGPVADGTRMHYYIEATDGNGNVTTEPAMAPANYHDFYIGLDVVEYDVNLDSLQTKTVNLTVVAPATALPNDQAFIDVIGTSTNDGAKSDSVETVTTVMPSILVVANSGDISQYTAALDNIGEAYDTGTPSSDMMLYQTVIWVENVGEPTSGDQTNLQNFLNGGGNLYINGEDLGYDLGVAGVGGEVAGFYRDYLHADYISDDSHGTLVDGVPGDAVTDGMSGFALTGSYPENITATAPAENIFTYSNSTPDAGYTGALKADTGVYKVVYIGFKYFEGTDVQVNKDLLMQRIIDWFVPKPQITHTPLTDTESHGPHTITATITDGSGDLNASSCTVHYSYNGIAYETPITMTDMGGDVFQGDIPFNAADSSVYYYISADDLALHHSTHPNGAVEGNPASVHSFYAGADIVLPEIEHTPLGNTANAQGPYTVVANFTDNIGIDISDTYVHWRTGLAGAHTHVHMTPTGAYPNEYSGDIPGQSSGTTVYYFIDVNDTANTPNYNRTPAAAHNSFQVLPDAFPPVILHTALTDTPGSGPYHVVANVTDGGVLDTDSIEMYYQLNGGGWELPVLMTPTGTPDFYEAYIPSQILGTVIDYYINASDMAVPVRTASHPPGAPTSYHTFEIIDFWPLLVVDDDPGDGSTTFINTSLDSLGETYNVEFYSADLHPEYYRKVIWNTGDAYSGDHFSTEKQTMVASYLDGGGKLYITGVELGYDIGSVGVGEPAGAFIWDYLCTDYLADSPGDTILDGVTGDPISDGFTGIVLEAAGLSTSRDDIAPAPGASTIFYDDIQDDSYGVKNDTGIFKVVYTSFNFAQFNNSVNRDLLMERILEWLSNPGITHTPLTDTESLGPYPIVATITDDDMGTATLYWSTDGVSYTPIGMSNIGNEYSANIPAQSWGTTVYYYIEATDLAAHTTTHPLGAPGNNHTFLVFEDTEAPLIVHTPLVDTPSTSPYTATATITDNLALDTNDIWLNYNTDGGAIYATIQMSSIGGDEYSADIPGQIAGTTIH